MKTPKNPENPASDPWQPGFTRDRSQYRFEHDGRRFKLFHRKESALWDFRFEHARKTHWITTGTANIKAAVERAKTHYDAVKGEKWDLVNKHKSRDTHATLGRIIEIYRERMWMKKAKIKDSTLRNNAQKLLRIVREGLKLSEHADAEALKSTVLTPQLVRDFQQARMGNLLYADTVTRGRAHLTMDSMLTQARAVFTPKAMELYREQKLKLPDLTEFLGVSKIGDYHDMHYVPIPDKVMAEMVEAAAKLRTESPLVYLMFQLMLRVGMRNAEVIGAQPGWLEPTLVTMPDGSSQVITMMAIINRPDFTPKNRMDRRVPVPEDVLKDINEIVPEGAQYILNLPTPTERFDVGRELNTFLRRFIPDREKGAYELRKHFGAIVAATQGIYKAQEYLGHRSVTTTEKHYASFLNGRNSRAMTMQDLLPKPNQPKLAIVKPPVQILRHGAPHYPKLRFQVRRVHQAIAG